MKCFVAGTPVWVAVKDKSGTWQVVSKAIETVKAGEYVIARNEHTGKTSVRQVLQTTIKHADVTVSVTLANTSGKAVETITSSREHPFFVEGKGFVPADGLAIGNAIVTRAGPSLVVKAVKWNRRVEGYDVYNFVVEEEHTYFVGLANGGAWVHNIDCPPLGLLEGKSANVTQKGLDIIENHLSQLDHASANDDMLRRLRDAMADGQKISGADLSYYTHELSEATMMGRGMSYEAAHAAALSKYGVDKFSVYHPEVIEANSGWFNSNWKNAWGL